MCGCGPPDTSTTNHSDSEPTVKINKPYMCFCCLPTDMHMLKSRSRENRYVPIYICTHVASSAAQHISRSGETPTAVVLLIRLPTGKSARRVRVCQFVIVDISTHCMLQDEYII